MNIVNLKLGKAEKQEEIDERDKIPLDDHMALEDVDMSKYEMDKRIKKKLLPLNDLWTFTVDLNGLWNNNLYPTKEIAIQFGVAYCKQHKADYFFIGKTEQSIDFGIDAKEILTSLQHSSLALTNFQSEYMKTVSEKAVYMLQDSLLEVLHEWLKEQHHETSTFSILADTVEKYDSKGKAIAFSFVE